MKIFTLGVLFALVFPQVADAQTSYARKSSKIVKLYSDSIKALNKAVSVPDSVIDETVISPYIYPLVGPPTYFSKIMRYTFSLPADSTDSNLSVGMDSRNEMLGFVGKNLMTTYSYHPTLVQGSDSEYEGENLAEFEGKYEPVKKNNDDMMKNIIDNTKEIKDVKEVYDDVDLELEVIKPNFWSTSATFSLDFSQNYISENWYKGGNNNGTMLAKLLIQANYNDQNKIQWDNKLDMRLGFVTTTSDSCHTFLTNNDKLNLYSKLGVKATKSWYYTLSFEANTQFMPGYKTNDKKTYSDFISPLNVYLSLGMDYKPTLKNSNTLSVALLPLSYKFRYIGTDDENVHSVYSMVGTSFEQSFGSKVEINTQVKVLDNVTWKSRFYYYTSYEYAEAELENSLTFSFNKYISSELYTLWRFDDSRSRAYYDDNLGYFQFKEYLTLGISFSF